MRSRLRSGAAATDRDPWRLEIGGKLLRGLLRIPGDPLDRPVDIRLLDVDLLGLGRLDLERFVDQVAKHLLAQRGRPDRPEWLSVGNRAGSARRWSTSVWVMTSPLTIAVALMTDGMAVPNSCGFSGRWSDWLLLIGCGWPVVGLSCAAPRRNAQQDRSAGAQGARANSVGKLVPRFSKFP